MKYEKKDKNSYSGKIMVYKILKIDYRAENIANHVHNRSLKFESLPDVILWLVVH